MLDDVEPNENQNFYDQFIIQDLVHRCGPNPKSILNQTVGKSIKTSEQNLTADENGATAHRDGYRRR
ncbi:hypothetical protein EVAR_27607_1 [Eumeta japonica]|uniref:Uncharacterized protein n=1 Tax=Eumeta variegata TaxID=151549 RepID=A0A4C1V268_EUMVA|nr:hypothetical protein EVAR_27607_1 [Eumeta japonica]